MRVAGQSPPTATNFAKVTRDTWEAFQVLHIGAVAEVSLIGSGKGNALGPAFWRESATLAQALGELATVRAIVLRGQGEHFSYGLDLAAMMTELQPLRAPDAGVLGREKLMARITDMQDAIEAWARCPKPVVAAIGGWCIGGAMHLVAACDVRLCAASTQFSLREVRLAMLPDLGALWRLPRIVGETHARHVALTGMDFDGERAARMGFVTDCLESNAALFERALLLAQTWATLPALAVQGVKQAMNAASQSSQTESLRACATWNTALLQSEDFAEAQAAFREKRPPHFRGE
ncbi:MAG: enoyl-CoA hydratase-related protein [Myxococcaceae bacterium]